MGNFCAVFMAFLQYASGVYIFKKPEASGTSPLLSFIIVMFAVFLLLLSIPLYPESLRKLWRCGHVLLQYIIAVFLMEHIMGNFWFPLEMAVLSFLPKTVAALEEFLARYNMNCDSVCEFLKWESTGFFCSYLLSIVFLIGTLHATRFIDLRLLQKGIVPFVQDIVKRIKKKCMTIRKLMFAPKNKPDRKGNRKVEFYSSDDDCYENEPADADYQYIYK